MGGLVGAEMFILVIFVEKSHKRSEKYQSRIAQADFDFQYDVEATYFFLEVCTQPQLWTMKYGVSHRCNVGYKACTTKNYN